MNKSIVAIAVAGLVGAVGFSSVASAEVTVYGRVTAGAVHSDNDKANDDGAWNFGATGIDGGGGHLAGTRYGFKGSQDMGNGMSAGFQIERAIRAGENPSVTQQRQNNVWLSGSWGKLTLGMQNNPYMNARHWDQTFLYGGAFGASYRHEGINYSMSNGPFSLNVMAMASSDSIDNDAVAINATVDASLRVNDAGNGAAVVPAAAPVADITADGVGDISGDDGIDGWIVHVSYDFGVAALNVSHHADNKDYDVTTAVTGDVVTGDDAATATNAATAMRVNGGSVDANASRDRTAIGVNGAVGPMDWYLAYETTSQNAGGGGFEDNDTSSVGGFLGFKASEKDTIYGYYVTHSGDRAAYNASGVATLGEDYTETIVGYSRAIGPGVRFIAEYQALDKDLDGRDAGSDTSNLALAVRYVF